MAGVWTQGFVAVPPGDGYTQGYAYQGRRRGFRGTDPDEQINGGGVPIERGAPPSSYAVAAVVNGERGSLARLIGVTAIRAVFIVPGVWLAARIALPSADVGLWKSGALALGASTSISAGLVAWYWAKKRMAET